MEIDNSILISVIVPIYNAEKFLPRCIESILDQTFKNFELLLINDGSKDSSLDICKKYLEKFPDKIRVFNNKNMGCSITRNFGIEKSQGKYLLFIDSDDWIEKDMLENMYEKVVSENSDVVITGFLREDNVLNTVFKRVPKYKNEPYFWLDTETLIEYACNKLHRKSLIINNNINFPTNIRLSEDLVFNIKVLLEAKKISILEKCLYHYIIHGDNAVLNIEKRKDIFLALDTIYKYLLNRKKNTNAIVFNKFKELSKIHVKAAFQKLMYLENKEEFKKTFYSFIKNTKEMEFLDIFIKFKIYKRAFIIYIIFYLNLKKIIEWREKVLIQLRNKRNQKQERV